jgi:hypothetical protein
MDSKNIFSSPVNHLCTLADRSLGSDSTGNITKRIKLVNKRKSSCNTEEENKWFMAGMMFCENQRHKRGESFPAQDHFFAVVKKYVTEKG